MQTDNCPDRPAKPRPRVTVSALAERDGRFLVVEEYTAGGLRVLNQPAGHVEYGESLVEAVIRETREETAWYFQPSYLIGVYLWPHPNGEISYLRFCFAGTVSEHDPNQTLDDGIIQAIWLSREELSVESARLRSPLVLGVIDDYLAGERYPLSILKPFLT